MIIGLQKNTFSFWRTRSKQDLPCLLCIDDTINDVEIAQVFHVQASEIEMPVLNCTGDRNYS